MAKIMKSDKRLTSDGDCRRGKQKRLYSVYAGILSRCNNPKRVKYKNYGGRGIKCEFLSYLDFKHWALSNGYNDTLTIERINVNGNYSKDNCKWIPAKDQVYNKTSLKLLNVDQNILKTQIQNALGVYGALTKLAKSYNCSVRLLHNYKHKLGVCHG